MTCFPRSLRTWALVGVWKRGVTLAYAFDDEGSAEEAVPVLESQWTEGISLIDAAPLSGFGSVVEAEAAGSVAVIELEITDRAPGVIFQMIQRRDLPLLHR